MDGPRCYKRAVRRQLRVMSAIPGNGRFETQAEVRAPIDSQQPVMTPRRTWTGAVRLSEMW